MRRISFYTQAFPEVPGLDTGISEALLRAVGRGDHPESLRLHTTGDIVAFGRHDTVTAGYPAAVAAARGMGFTPIERLAGGRAAVFSTGTLAFAWAMPTPRPRERVMERFEQVATILRNALRAMGADAEIGELDGEYCPGAYSIHVDGRVKVMGVGQRLVRGAAHTGGVICVTDGDRIREVLTSVYRALDLEWSPATAGALEDVMSPTSLEAVENAVTKAFRARVDLIPSTLPDWIVEQGQELASRHLAAH